MSWRDGAGRYGIAGALVVALPFLALAIPSVRRSAIEHRDRAFTAAAWNGDIRRMQVLRLFGADAERNDGGNGLAITAAAWTGKTEVIRYLLDNGADVNQRDKFGLTALIAASDNGKIETVRYLVSRNADVNAIGEDGSALRRAREKGHLEVATFLESRGALDRFGWQAHR